MGILSKGMKLSYKVGTEFVDLTDLLTVPALGGSAESVEITTLEDSARTYMKGLDSYGDSVDFQFLYAPEQFMTLSALDDEADWKVTIPQGKTCTFKGSASVKFDGGSVGERLTYTLSVKPSSAMVFA